MRYALELTEWYGSEFGGEFQAYSAVIADTNERSMTYTREYASVTQLRASVWFNIGPVTWVGRQLFASIEEIVCRSQ